MLRRLVTRFEPRNLKTRDFVVVALLIVTSTTFFQAHSNSSWMPGGGRRRSWPHALPPQYPIFRNGFVGSGAGRTWINYSHMAMIEVTKCSQL
ncbi:hypothetical protein CYMTET_27358 [Cymbomonas tetramitiformis]|uniref:Uncharacterized protein n=1 Tax=Cymbomonas tetramitiformis TaxID=36881 RepID=A0AAE0FQJ3_9CHLO|nr:hypothetical protein CYMTET_27358 [Cymbomonas tetramitiformis]